ncbi:hypothetical protein V8G61_12650 [Gaetbulibacter sp. M240]|uniref:hypothetical protein n=1 Tax=Gaetbulibacter sp. M240 TaxID=3126511 RepID=UPI00374FC0C5
MKLIQRVGYYLTGFSIGLVMLIFFLNGKKASCSYFPNARVVKNISTKKIIFNSETAQQAVEFRLDTTQIRDILKRGDVDFGASEQRKKPCGIYYITSLVENKEMAFTVKNCDSLATIIQIAKETN